ncbi:MAG: DUF480 domain-containing protein [Gammaproteobacteria bacterium]
MDITLTALEARVIGALIEKEITTPDQYPLSLNALVNACNQKSNREPVTELDEAQVQDTVDGLVKKHMVSEKTAFGSRVTKYRQRFCNTEFGSLTFSPQELGILCVLLLRGAQTPGELRTRTSRLCRFDDVQEAEAVLDRLMEREDGPFAARLPREPGKRESRYVQLFSETPQFTESPVGKEVTMAGGDAGRLDRLEQQVIELFREVGELRERLDGLAAE